jgi:hypothetical protein
MEGFVGYLKVEATIDIDRLELQEDHRQCYKTARLLQSQSSRQSQLFFHQAPSTSNANLNLSSTDLKITHQSSSQPFTITFPTIQLPTTAHIPPRTNSPPLPSAPQNFGYSTVFDMQDFLRLRLKNSVKSRFALLTT